MKKLKVIWQILWSRYYCVATAKDFLQFSMKHNCDGVELRQIEKLVCDDLEAYEAVEYTKTFITEL